MRGVQDGGAPPRALVAPAFENRALCIVVAVEIGRNQKEIVEGERIDQTSIAIRLLWRKNPRRDRFQRLGELRRARDRVLPANTLTSLGFDLLRG